MPRYFFNVYHERSEPDDLGEELPDRHAAWKEATITAGQILQGLDGKLQPSRDWRMEVSDEFANPLFVSTHTGKAAGLSQARERWRVYDVAREVQAAC